MNKKGEINLITIIGIVVILAFILFVTIIFIKLNNNSIEVSNNTANTTNVENTTNTTNTTNTNEIGKTNNKDEFTFSFLKKENEKKNMVYSPLSIKYALKMLQDGASGNTYSQIEKVVGNLNLPKYNISGQKQNEGAMSLANGIFIRDTYYKDVKQSYKDILTNKYNAEILQDKFKNARNVNNWIENKTLGIIKNMLSDNLVTDENLEMLLVNALAIDIEWKENFNDNNTYGDTFFKADETEIQATTMKKETSSDASSYYVGKDITAISMDLKEVDGNKMEFMAIMPESNLDKYISELTTDKINDITKNLKSASTAKDGINIKIPKFSFDYDLRLKQDLMDLGIKDAFNDSLANFSNMTSKNDLYVGEALHKANIDFTEKGVKAAAVTVFAMLSKAAIMEPNQPIEVEINKPFVFLIRDKNTKEIWFVGTVYEPNLWENDKIKYQKGY